MSTEGYWVDSPIASAVAADLSPRSVGKDAEASMPAASAVPAALPMPMPMPRAQPVSLYAGGEASVAVPRTWNAGTRTVPSLSPPPANDPNAPQARQNKYEKTIPPPA